MLISNSISVLRKVNAIVGWIYRDFSVQIPGWRKQHIPGSQVLSRTNIWANVCIRRFLSDLSDSTSSSDDDIDELCIYEPDVRRIRIVTRNDMYANDLMEDAASSPPSVHRDTVYTRQNVTDDDPAVQSLFRGICEGSRSALARAITLTESVHPRRRAEAQVLMREVLEHTRKKRTHSLHRVNSFRIGLSGPPGAGKSTHIETLGKLLTSLGHKVAVLAVDPSSSTTGALIRHRAMTARTIPLYSEDVTVPPGLLLGSLLGDKTRMPQLSCDPNAYIRPSPSSGYLGGVTQVTNDAIILCEGAGYDIILVETVGVGQSEFAVADMVDMFELLIPPAGGDELQGIKRGIVEVADVVVVNKSDGDLVPAARRMQTEYTSALKFVRPRTSHWRPQVMRVSSTTGEGLPELWAKIKEFRQKMTLSGELQRRREKQHVRWMKSHITDKIQRLFLEHPAVCRLMPKLEFLVEKGAVTPGYASDVLVQQFSSCLRFDGNVSMSEVTRKLLKAEKELTDALSSERENAG